MVPKFLAHMGLFLVISGVLEGIFAQICGKEWEKRNPEFSAVRFLPFLAHMGPFLVIFWVLEVAHSGTFLPKYAHGSEEDWEKRKFTVPSKMSMEQ